MAWSRQFRPLWSHSKNLILHWSSSRSISTMRIFPALQAYINGVICRGKDSRIILNILHGTGSIWSPLQSTWQYIELLHIFSLTSYPKTTKWQNVGQKALAQIQGLCPFDQHIMIRFYFIWLIYLCLIFFFFAFLQIYNKQTIANSTHFNENDSLKVIGHNTNIRTATYPFVVLHAS